MVRVKRALCLIVSIMIFGALHGAGTVDSDKSTIDFPHDQSYVNTNQPTIIGTLRDSAGVPVINETVQILIDGIVIGTATSDTFGIYRLLVPNALADGEYELSIFCVESQSTIESNTFNVDTTFPLVTITYPQEGAHVSGAVITIAGTTEALAMVVTFLDGDTFGNICYADEYGNWSIEYEVTAGNHSITAQTTDIAGNQGYMCEVINFSVTP